MGRKDSWSRPEPHRRSLPHLTKEGARSLRLLGVAGPGGNQESGKLKLRDRIKKKMTKGLTGW